MQIVWIEKMLLWIFLLFHTVSDLKSRRINIIVCLLFSLLGLVKFAYYGENEIVSLAGGILIGAYLLVFSLLTKEAIGLGDGCVVIAVGIWIGGGKTLLVLVGGFVLTAICGLVRIGVKKADRKTELPFVPFFSVAYAVFYLGGMV